MKRFTCILEIPDYVIDIKDHAFSIMSGNEVVATGTIKTADNGVDIVEARGYYYMNSSILFAGPTWKDDLIKWAEGLTQDVIDRGDIPFDAKIISFTQTEK